ncbi:hypothetical protein cand_023880 [Cryptosporidium andersoni]|uniref:Transmembrane protein n=1 Tax=Cryptosporidium andersoni TaxID=117008 RepID=A0A1J4MVX4_9CRYT|nr:hypothetical protein cand_023880 [Cryptosporidium andersoni]
MILNLLLNIIFTYITVLSNIKHNQLNNIRQKTNINTFLQIKYNQDESIEVSSDQKSYIEKTTDYKDSIQSEELQEPIMKDFIEENYNKMIIKRSPKKVKLSYVKPKQLIERPEAEKVPTDEFTFMVRPNERMLGIDQFVIPEIEKLNKIYYSISAGSILVEGEGSIKNLKIPNFGHYSLPGFIKDEIFNKEYYLSTVPFIRYTPLFIEVRGSAYNAALHGIYQRDDSLILSNTDQRYPWYADPIRRPVYKRISSNPTLYIFFLTYPLERWCIGDTWPISNPKSSTGKIYAEILGRPYSPAFSRGWYVQPRKYAAHDIVPYIDLDPSSPLRNPLPVKIPSGLESKRVVVFDKDLIVDEARPFTFLPPKSLLLQSLPLVQSPDDVELFPGCPNMHMSKFSGITKYNTPTCIPPTRGILDIVLNGANGYFNNALYSWEGYFKNRPYFVQRGPLRDESGAILQSSIVEYPGDTLYLWSLVEEPKKTIWYLSRQLGNTHPSQVGAIWQRPKSSRVTSPVDWPAERGLELEPDGWTFLRPPFKKKYLYNTPKGKYSDEKTFIRVQGLKEKNVKMVISGAPEDINGDYYHLGDYLGFPFFRQRRNKKRNHPGYVLYRGTVISKSKDLWVIGTTLGSIHGIKAYAIDYPKETIESNLKSRSGFAYYGGTRWPHQLPLSTWRTWMPVDNSIEINIYSKELKGRNAETVAKEVPFQWKTFESLFVNLEYIKPDELFKHHVTPVIGNPFNKKPKKLPLGYTEPNIMDLSATHLNKHSTKRESIEHQPIENEKYEIQNTQNKQINMTLSSNIEDLQKKESVSISSPNNLNYDTKWVWIGISILALLIILIPICHCIRKHNLKNNKHDYRNPGNQDIILGRPEKLPHPNKQYII